MRLQHPALALEERHLLLELVLDLVLSALDRRFEVTYCVAGKMVIVSSFAKTSPVSGVEVRDLLDLVAEHRDAVRRLRVRRLDLDHVALDLEAAAAEERVVADVLDVDQLCSITSRSVSSPTVRKTTRFSYSSGEPRP